jgi:hypothetical protein
MIKCSNCQKEYPDGTPFCDECGSALAQSQPPAPTQGPAPAGGQTDASVIQCPHCKGTHPAGTTFCDQTGQPIGGEAGSTATATAKAKLIILESPSQSAKDKEITLPDKPEALIGRTDPVNNNFPEVDLDSFGAYDAGVSRKHAKIIKSDTGYVIENTSQVNWTMVNKDKVDAGKQHPLADGDEILLGKLKLRFVVQK